MLSSAERLSTPCEMENASRTKPNRRNAPHVRFTSESGIAKGDEDVRFVPEADIRQRNEARCPQQASHPDVRLAYLKMAHLWLECAGRIEFASGLTPGSEELGRITTTLPTKRLKCDENLVGRANRLQIPVRYTSRMRALHRNDNIVPLAFDRRQTARRSVQHIGKILTEPKAPPEYCLVTETSKGGVRVRIYTASDFQAPNVFTLSFENIEAQYQVIWRNGHFVGAELTS